MVFARWPIRTWFIFVGEGSCDRFTRIELEEDLFRAEVEVAGSTGRMKVPLQLNVSQFPACLI